MHTSVSPADRGCSYGKRTSCGTLPPLRLCGGGLGLDLRHALRHGLRWRLMRHRRRLGAGVEGEGWVLLDQAGEVGVDARLPAVEPAQEIEDAFRIAILHEDHDGSDDH